MPARTNAPPDSLTALVERFDASVFDAPSGRARIRLVVRGAGSWDVEVSPRGRATLVAAQTEHRPDAEITADALAWRQVGRDLAGGLAAHRAGRLTVRRDMHIGVGFLAATSGLTGEGRLRFARIPTRHGRIAIMEAGTG